MKTPEKCSFILHKKPAAVLKSILGKDDGTAQIAFDPSTVLSTFGKTTMVCRLIVGKYPKYPRCDPSEQLQRAEDRQGDVPEHGKACGRLRQQGFQPHQAGSQAGTDEITAQDLGFAIAAYEKINCDYSGDELTIGFKSTFLTEILANMSCETVVMKFADARRAALIIPSRRG